MLGRKAVQGQCQTEDNILLLHSFYKIRLKRQTASIISLSLAYHANIVKEDGIIKIHFLRDANLKHHRQNKAHGADGK